MKRIAWKLSKTWAVITHLALVIREIWRPTGGELTLTASYGAKAGDKRLELQSVGMSLSLSGKQ